MQITSATWNILADCYCSEYQQEWNSRKDKIRSFLNLVSYCDILMMQEIDHYEDFFQPLLLSLSYTCKYIQRPKKLDGCLVCYKCDKFVCLDYEVIHFDDIAELSPSTSRLFGANFARQNVGEMLLLQCIENNTLIIVACAHLYWNPTFPEVKSAQAIYLLQRLHNFSKNQWSKYNTSTSIILGGDFNIMPDSLQYNLFANTIINVHSSIAPSVTHIKHIEEVSLFEHFYKREIGYFDATKSVKFICDSDLIRLCRWLRVLGVDAAMYTPTSPPLDNQEGTTNESNHSKSLSDNIQELNNATSKRTKNVVAKLANKKYIDYNFHKIFQIAQKENRIILTTSKSMRQRNTCPESMLINARDLEQSLVNIFYQYNLSLDKDKFLTVCGKCGGDIVSVTNEEYRKYAMETNAISTTGQEDETISENVNKNDLESFNNDNDNNNNNNNNDDSVERNICSEGYSGTIDANVNIFQPPVNERWLPTDREIFMCVRCMQPYWWNQSEKSSPARAMMLANHLHEQISRGINVLESQRHHQHQHHAPASCTSESDGDIYRNTKSLSASFDKNKDKVCCRDIKNDYDYDDVEAIREIWSDTILRYGIRCGNQISDVCIIDKIRIALKTWRNVFCGDMEIIEILSDEVSQYNHPTIHKLLIGTEHDIPLPAKKNLFVHVMGYDEVSITGTISLQRKLFVDWFIEVVIAGETLTMNTNVLLDTTIDEKCQNVKLLPDGPIKVDIMKSVDSLDSIAHSMSNLTIGKDDGTLLQDNIQSSSLVEMFRNRDKNIPKFDEMKTKMEESNQNQYNVSDASASTVQAMLTTHDCEISTQSMHESTKIDINNTGCDRETCAENDSFCLKSAYKAIHQIEPAYTNWTDTFIGTLDYIFVSQDLTVLDSYVLPSLPHDPDRAHDIIPKAPHQIVSSGPFPNEVFPSDHIVVVAKLALSYHFRDT